MREGSLVCSAVGAVRPFELWRSGEAGHFGVSGRMWRCKTLDGLAVARGFGSAPFLLPPFQRAVGFNYGKYDRLDVIWCYTDCASYEVVDL